MENIIDRVNKKIFELVESNKLEEIIVTPKFCTCLQLSAKFTIDPNVFIDEHIYPKLVGRIITENDYSFNVKRTYDPKDHIYEIIYDSDMNKLYTCIFDLEFPKTLE